LCILSLITVPLVAATQTCTTLAVQIRKERNLLKKQALIQKSLELCPDDAAIHYSAGYAAERLRKYERAQSYYLKASELDPKYAKAYFGLGDIYMVLGNAGSAIDAYKKGLQLVPQNKRARASLNIAKIKDKAERGKTITAGDFIQVMQQSKKKETTQGAIDGPLLRMQIHFLLSSAQLSEDAKSQLQIVGKALEDPALNGQFFEISGHTDDTGPPETNLALSKARAEQVREYLLNTFAIAPSNLVVAYYGDTRPARPNTTMENRALNRRVEFKRLDQ
jgi:outer membrane protein OmpA-like peptidoglycan-associated protein